MIRQYNVQCSRTDKVWTMKKRRIKTQESPAQLNKNAQQLKKINSRRLDEKVGRRKNEKH